MQKKIIALAIAGLASTAAFAQTNVQIYGVADAAAIYINTNGGDTLNTFAPGAGRNLNARSPNEGHGRDSFSIQSGQLAGSRLGFRGTEDLGNGVKAVFVLEYSLDLDQNTGVGSGVNGLFARQQYVGLQSKAGEVTLGRQYAPGFWSIAMDPTVASPALSSVDAGQAFIGSTIRAASAARWNNSVVYKSPSMGGFSAHAIYSAGETANEVQLGESYGVGADFAAGPVAVKYVYHRAAIGGQVNNVGGAHQDEHYVGASFDAKVVKLMGSVQTVDQGNIAAAGGRANTGMMAQLGAVVPLGKGNLHLSGSYADANGATTLNAVQSGVAPLNAYRGEQYSYNVAYTHGLSKRTTLYTGYRYTEQDAKNAGIVVNAFGMGINHAF